MTQLRTAQQPSQHYRTHRTRQGALIASSSLLLIAFASAFFPRILESLGAPSPINFLHFVAVPVAASIVLLTCPRSSRQQLAIVKALLIGLFLLLVVSTASALLNRAGIINVFLGLMIIAEPFIFLAALLAIPLTLDSLNRLKKWVFAFGGCHLALVYLQTIGLQTGLLQYTRMTLEDNIQGVFYLSSGGHVVAASASLAFGLYYYVSAKAVPHWTRMLVLAAVVGEILFADTKQVVMVAFVAWALLILSQSSDLRVALKYLIAALLLGYAFYWCVYNIDAFRAYQTWIRPEIYGPGGDARVLKGTPLRLIPTYYHSWLNWFLGLGPGHTVGRIGGWMVRDYWSLLAPLGATVHPVSSAVRDAWTGHYLDSSFFSPLWGWAGIWGDIGFLGLGSYLMLWTIIWTQVCKDNVSRFLVLNILVNGFIFTLMEEPGFVLTSVFLIGLRWHERRLQQTSKRKTTQQHFLTLQDVFQTDKNSGSTANGNATP